ncbi:MAG: hypothetical protein US81_C0016G0019 [Parcubacteria group bacterium GW2011_GWE2_38_18]|nr:MAG: hypothetical protein US81_C0016G0019 [Parcubacteria group bacterium GW2011_GWE2_38_18]
MKYNNILETIGNTPIVKINKLFAKTGVNIYVKLERINPGGSIKDRIAISMIEDAELSGNLNKKMTIIEPTSGNTGIGLAMVAAIKNYKISLVLPENVSEERKKILTAYGAKIILSDKEEGIDGAIRLARKLVGQNSKKFIMLNQYDNVNNPRVHYEKTAEEILHDLPELTHFVAGLGTSGTFMGIAQKLKEKKSNVVKIAVEPSLKHKIQGLKNMKEAIVPQIYDKKMIDKKITVSDNDAFATLRQLSRHEGMFLGMSSGANIYAAMQVGKKIEKGNILVIAPDGGEKYLSTGVFN